MISVDDALAHQIQEKYKAELDQEFKKKEAEMAKKLLDLNKKDTVIKEREKALEESEKLITEQVQERLDAEKKIIIQEAEQKANKKSSQEVNLLKDQLEDTEKKLSKSQKLELEVRKDKNKLEEEKKSFELEKQRQIDEEREKIRDEVLKSAEEQHRFKDAEKDKKLQDAIKANDELRRKLEQGSQQTQGEVVELELELVLKNAFPFDEIIPIGKGVNGADVHQKVRDRNGRECGTIVWESKHTKGWSDGWIAKLKEDQRNAKAEIAVIVSKVLPQNIKNFAFHDGVWVSNFECLIPLANALRANLTQVAQMKYSAIGKNEKMEVIYNYLCGIEFRQKVEAIVEAFVLMKDDLDREKRSMTKAWATREKQIQRVVDNTVGMYGDLQGLIGSSMPTIESLEMPLLESPDDVETETPKARKSRKKADALDI